MASACIACRLLILRKQFVVVKSFCKSDCQFLLADLNKTDLENKNKFLPAKKRDIDCTVNFMNTLTKKPKIQIFPNFWRLWPQFRQIFQIYHKRTHLLENWVT